MTEGAEGSAVPNHAKGSWASFIKSVASFNGDLSSLTAPAFILSTTSLTEFSAYWSEMPGLLVAPAKEKDPEKRMYLVVKWFLSTLKQQYASRSEKLGSEKKPLNPFLGELFLGKWDDECGTTQLVSKHGVNLQGYNAQKVTFLRTFHIRQVGHAMLHIDEFDEDYLITLPSLQCEGLITGSPYMELNKSTYIVSSSGYSARIDYAGKGWVSGSKNSVSAVIYPHGKEKSKADHIYTAEGQWTKQIVFKKGHDTVETYNAQSEKKTELTVAPIEDQDPLESRRAWKKVADAIRVGDMNATSAEKTVIEVSQRELRKKEAAEHTEWPRRFFSRATTSPIFEKLVKDVPHGALEADQTNGVWVFDQAKAASAKPPFQPYSEQLLKQGK
ncbi:hypothetical protein AMS68_000599 [Peltaster fructicola]|uniref:Oxysterol binding protein n=1 Tax=Peltaster fructicola TaxID=286661 RepID=A0A6H0XK34_9PEZI|nr:hypothetical protein AMS68_000599 [Peltaster fructicola]